MCLYAGRQKTVGEIRKWQELRGAAAGGRMDFENCVDEKSMPNVSRTACECQVAVVSNVELIYTPEGGQLVVGVDWCS